MTAPEKYTLPQVLEIVQYHAARLGTAAGSLEATEGNDPEVLAMVGARALNASEALWAIDSFVGFNQPVDGYDQGLFDVWYSGDGGGAVGHARNVLPLLVLAVEGADTFTDREDVATLEPWGWCRQHAETIAEDLMKWVMEHEKDANAETTPVEAVQEPTERGQANGATPSPSQRTGRVWRPSRRSVPWASSGEHSWTGSLSTPALGIAPAWTTRG